uniref:Uncharacterized protein n=1 Tax=Triticum urartu TaxID=4572 RepID=A0A8R7UK18_TRIUA
RNRTLKPRKNLCVVSGGQPRHGQRRDLREGRGQGAGQRRGPADGAGRVLPEPGVDALPVEQVAAVRQHAEHVAVAVVVEAHGAAGAGGAQLPVLAPPRLAVHHLRVPLERGLVDAELHVDVVAGCPAAIVVAAALAAPRTPPSPGRPFGV